MSTNEAKGYSIQQLAEKASVSVRTIRFYINEGLLTAPPVKGRYAVYNDEYLDRLELIRRLKESFLPLKEIRERVTSLSWEEVKQALAQPSQPAVLHEVSEQRGERALDYITNLLKAAPAPAVARSQPPPAAMPAPPETWERVTLAPGIELHIRSNASPVHQRLARQVIEYAKKLFTRSIS